MAIPNNFTDWEGVWIGASNQRLNSTGNTDHEWTDGTSWDYQNWETGNRWIGMNC
jgi:hypothetical protein